MMSGVSLASTLKHAISEAKDVSLVAYVPTLARGEGGFGRPDCGVQQLGLTGFPV
jgi:hypothetical protein